MTAQADLLRRVGIALDCYASTLHAQAWVQSNPGVKDAKEQERADIEALREEVRLLAQQPAPESEWEMEGMRAALARHMPTHSPYAFGPQEAHDAWLKGWRPVRDELNWWQALGAQEGEQWAQKAEEEAAELREENRRLREALEWYADEGNLDAAGSGRHMIGYDNPDRGQTARAALSAAEAPAGRDG